MAAAPGKKPPGPGEKSQEEIEEEMAAERELADDAQWKIIQKNTFTRWANEHLKTAKMVIIDLEKDLSDGLRLIGLIEVLSGKKFGKFNKKPTFRTQKFENVTQSLRFLEDKEGIKIVNIDSSDIVDQKIKLIMGLIWTLILHYSISMPMWEDEDPAATKDQTPKQRLLEWIRSKIPEKNITNFTSDWNDGTAIAALVDALGPGLCPDWPQMNPKNAIDNAKKAMDAAEKWMDVPQLIKPDEMCNPKVDELSMMTYLSRFPHAKLKPGAPVQIKPNAARVRAYGPGLEPTGNVVGAPARFTVETSAAGTGELEVVVLNPKGTPEKCHVIANNDRLLSYSCVYVPTMEGQYKVTIKFAKQDIPKCPYLVAVSKPGDASKVTATGPGIEKTGVQVNRKTYFEVITKGCGAGVVDVGIVDPKGAKNTVRPVITKKSADLWYVEYTAFIPGLHSVNVFFAGKQITNSPFAVSVAAEGAAPVDPSKLGKPQTCTPLEAAQATQATPLKAAPGSTAPADEKKPAPEDAQAKKPGAVQVLPPPAAKPTAPDAKKCYATGRGIQPKGNRVGEEALFKIFTEGAGGGNGEPRVMIMGPGGSPEKNTITKVDNYYTCVYKPIKPGLYIVTVQYAGQPIQKSPFRVDVAPMKTSKVRAYGPGLKTGMVGHPATFRVVPHGEPGQLGLRVEGPSQARLEPKKNADGSMDVAYFPTEPGEYAVHVLCNQDDIPKSPYMADIKPAPAGFDPSKVTAHGPGLQPEGVVLNAVTEFTVDASKAGPVAALDITAVDADSNVVDVKVTDNHNGTYTCRYTPIKPSLHTICISYGGVAIPNSPFKVSVGAVAAAPVGKAKVYGPALEKAVKTFQPTYLIVDCKEAGPGEVKVSLTDVSGAAVPFKLIDNKDKTYRVEFQATVVGVLTASVTYAGQPATDSPYKITVESALDLSKVQVNGLPESVTVGKEVPFEIITAGAGPGQAKVTVNSPSGKPVPALTTAKADGFSSKFIPLEKGAHSVQVTFADQPVPRSPFTVTATEAADASKVRVYGPAVEAPVTVKQTTYLIVDCKDAGQGAVQVTLTDAQGQSVPVRLIDNKDKTFRAEFEASVTGVYSANVTFAGVKVPGSPYSINVQPAAVDVSAVQVQGLPQSVTVGKEVPFDILTSAAGPGQSQVNITSPTGRPVPCSLTAVPVGTAAKFVPAEAGPHSVQVTFNDQPVPGSPFTTVATQVGDASKVKVYGPAVEAPVTLHQLSYLIVDCKEAGPGEVAVTMTTDQGVVIPVKLVDNHDGTYRVEFEATSVGTYNTSVTFAGQLTPASPYKITVQQPTAVDTSKVRVTDLPDNVPVGKEARLHANTVEAGPGQAKLTVLSPSGQQVPATVEPAPEGFTGKFVPQELGPHSVNVSYAEQPIPGSPFRITATQPVGAANVKVYGPAVDAPVQAHTVSYLIVDCKEAGPGEVAVTMTTDQGVVIPVKLVDNHDGTYRVEFEATSVGTYNTSVTFAGQLTPASPYKITVQQPTAVDTSKVRVTDLPDSAATGRELVFGVNTAEVGPAPVGVNVLNPVGQPVPSSVEPKPDGVTGKFTPVQDGPHTVDVTYAGAPVPGSPFKVQAMPAPTTSDASKVKAYGSGLTTGTASKPADFTIDTRMAGPGGLGLTIDGPTESKIECFDKGGGLFDVRYWPTEPGEYTTNILFDDQPIPHSPFRAQVNPAKMVDVSGVKVYGNGVEPTGVFLDSTTDFTVDATSVEPKAEGLVRALITSPSGTLTEAIVKNQQNGLYQCLYTPVEQGPHKVDITYEGLRVPNSPFTAGVVPGCDPSRVKVYGPGLKSGQINKPQTFTIETRGAGQGGVGLSVVGPTEPKIGCVDNHDGTLTVEYLPNSVGSYEIAVSFADQPVPGSPFHATVSDDTAAVLHESPAAKVKCYGAGLQPTAVHKGQKAVFTVDATQATVTGAPVNVTTTDLTTGAVKQAQVTARGNGLYEVEYTPDAEGPCKVDVSYAGHAVPNSPFTTNVQPAVVDARKVTVSGVGLRPDGVPASLPVSFKVDTRDAGQADLDVVVTDDRGETVKSTVERLPDGTYAVTYTPEEVAHYTVSLKYGGQEVPNAPFHIKTVPSGNASLVSTASGSVVKPQLSVGEECSITLNKAAAGPGRVTCHVVNTSTSSQVKATVIDNHDGTVTIKYVPSSPGTYTMDVKYGGVTIPTGRITQQVVEEMIQPVTEAVVERAMRPAAQMTPVTQAQFGLVESTTTSVQMTPVPQAQFGLVESTATTSLQTKPVTQAQFGLVDTSLQTTAVTQAQFGLVESTTTSRVQSTTFTSATTTATSATVHAPLPAGVVPVEPMPTPIPGQPTPYHAVDFCVPVGPDFSLVNAVVTTPSLKKYRPSVVSNQNGTVSVQYSPTEPGAHTLEMSYAGVPLQDSPYKFSVEPAKPGQVTVHGAGLSSGLAGQPTSFTVVTKDAGPGGLGLSIEGPSKAEIQCQDNKDGTCTITYVPTLPGEYKIAIKYAGQPITDTPYFAKISTPFGEEQAKSQVSLASTNQLSLSVSETDLSNLTATIKRPSGLEEPCGLKRQPSGQLGISFTPREVGDHWVSVYRSGQPIAGSPFKVVVSQSEIGNASKVRTGGRGLTQGMANEINEFLINTRDAGIGGLGMSIEGPGKVDIKCFENPGGTCRVAYNPSEPGTYQLSVKYADEHIPGSPFTVNVGGQPSGRVTERIDRQQQAVTQTTGVGSMCQLNITLAGMDLQNIAATVTSPSGATEQCQLLDLGANRYTVKFVPREMGVHTVSLKHKGLHIPGSPFQFTVGPIVGGGPHKVRAVGSGLVRGEVNKPNPFTIITREAGAGGISLGIEGPSKAVIDFQDKRDGTSDVTYTVTQPGDYLISVKFNDQLIPDSPFKVCVLPAAGDSQRLHVHDLQQLGLQVNSPSQFIVDFNGVQGKLDAKVVAPSGTETEANVQQTQQDRYAVNFVPRESGLHYVHVKLNGVHVPGSPYPVQVGRLDADASQVRAYGDGLYKGFTGQLCKFIVDTSKAGCSALSVNISGPSRVELISREVEEGYEFSYTPLSPGDYLITVKYAGTHVPGSPFNAHIEGPGVPGSIRAESRMVIETVSKSTRTTTTTQQQQQQQQQQTFTQTQQLQQLQQQQQQLVQPVALAVDASKVSASGSGLHQANVNQESSFIVDGSQSGYNMLVVGIAGPRVPCEQLSVVHMSNLKYIVKYRLSQPGNYVLMVKWGDEHIRGSPFNIVAQ